MSKKLSDLDFLKVNINLYTQDPYSLINGDYGRVARAWFMDFILKLCTCPNYQYPITKTTYKSLALLFDMKSDETQSAEEKAKAFIEHLADISVIVLTEEYITCEYVVEARSGYEVKKSEQTWNAVYGHHGMYLTFRSKYALLLWANVWHLDVNDSNTDAFISWACTKEGFYNPVQDVTNLNVKINQMEREKNCLYAMRTKTKVKIEKLEKENNFNKKERDALERDYEIYNQLIREKYGEIDEKENELSNLLSSCFADVTI